MRIVATDVAKGPGGSALPPISCSFETGRVSLVEAETGQRPTVLSLILSGRMHPDAGTVTIDGAADPALMRERIALVDAVDVSEPAGDLLLRQVVKEELMYAERSTSRATVLQVIDDNGGHAYADARVGDVPGAVRTRILAELAAFRRGVQAIVLAEPDRHGGDPREWFAVAEELAARDFAVAVVVGAPSAEILRPLLPPEPDIEPAPGLLPSRAALPAQNEGLLPRHADPDHPAPGVATPTSFVPDADERDERDTDTDTHTHTHTHTSADAHTAGKAEA